MAGAEPAKTIGATMKIKGSSLLRKARRSHAFRRRHDPSLLALRSGGRILSDGSVELTQADGSTIVYQVEPVLGYRTVPATRSAPIFTRIVRAVRVAVVEALAGAGLPADAPIDLLPIYRTAKEALGRQTNEAAVRRVAAAAADLAIERYLDIITTPVAAE
jgi:hypothetical protein